MGTEIYTVGGTVQANAQGLYIPRQADQDLLQLCRDSTFAYVLTPRQMGKSSLMMRTAETLYEEGIQAVVIDLTQIGTNLSAEQWYLGLLTTVVDQLMLSVNVYQWWQDRHYLGVTQRLSQFFEQVLISATTDPVVIFIDEIDTTLTLGFADDFYAAIRGLYVARAKQPELLRLSFVLIGVATPNDLIQDAKRTPFNVGERVELNDFTQLETLPMADGLGLPAEKAGQVLAWVLKWTGGHPYLTQRLCKALVDEGIQDWQETEVDGTVHRTFLGEESEKDNNLQFVRDMLIRRAPDGEEAAVLQIYRQVLQHQFVKDDELSLVKSHLKLAGVVRTEGKALKNRNLIYQIVFDKRWIQRQLPESLWQKLKPAMPIIATLSVFSAVTLGMAIYSDRLRRVALIRENIAKIQYLLSTRNPSTSIVYAIDMVDLSQSFPEVKFASQGVLLKSIQQLKELNRLQGHQNSVNSVSFSPDGKQLVSGSSDGTVRLWDAQSGKPLGKPLGEVTDSVYGESINSVSFSPNGKWMVSGSSGGTLRIWDVQTGKLIGKPHNIHDYGYVKSVSFSPDGTQIASVSNDTLIIWDVQTGELIVNRLKLIQDSFVNSINSVSFSPDGKRIVSGSSDGIRLWDAKSGEQIGEPLQTNQDPNQDSINSVSFSPDGSQIVSGHFDNTIRLWDVESGKQLGEPLQGHQDSIFSVSFSSDGTRIVSGSRDSTVRLWDAQSGEQIGEPLQGHQSFVNSVSFSPDGKWIASGSWDNTVRLWDAQNGEPLGSDLIGEPLSSKALSEIIGEPLQDVKLFVYSVSFSPDGKRIASGSWDNTVRLWDAQSGKQIGKPLLGHQSSVLSVAFSPDGKRIISGSSDETIRLWDAQSGKQIGKPLLGHQSSVHSVSFSPDGKRIISGSNDKTARLWDVQSGKQLGEPLEDYNDSVWTVSFSPDGKRIVGGGASKDLHLWDAQSGKLLGKPLKGHQLFVYSVSFSPDGKRIVSGSNDKTVRIWDAQSGKQIGEPLQGHQNVVMSVSFSPDGKRIVSGSWDETVRLWDAQNGEPIGDPLQNHKSAVSSVSFSPDGKRIISGGLDNTIRLWEVHPKVLTQLACNRFRNHPLLRQPEEVSSDPLIIKAAKRSQKVCEQHIPSWESSQASQVKQWLQGSLQ